MEASSEEIDKSKLVISPISEPMASDKLTVKTNKVLFEKSSTPLSSDYFYLP